MKKRQDKEKRKYRRKLRIRFKIHGTASRPRLNVFRSHKHIYAQLIDDEKGVTLLSASDRELKGKKREKEEGKMAKKEKIAFAVGQILAEKAAAKKIKQVVFDRGSNQYHGRIKALAEGARKGNLNF